MYAFISKKNGCPIFPIFFLVDGGGDGTLLPSPKRLICCCRLWEIAAIIATDTSFA
jgi:hypothetical protein